MAEQPTFERSKTSRNQAILAAWQAGTPDIAIGRRFGITGGRVRDIINAARG